MHSFSYLELVVNQMNTQRVVPVVQRQGQLLVSASELQAVGIRLPASGPQRCWAGQRARFTQRVRQPGPASIAASTARLATGTTDRGAFDLPAH